MQSVLVLGVIVLIRTVLSFSLETEIEGVAPWRRAAMTGAERLWRATRDPGARPDPAGAGDSRSAARPPAGSSLAGEAHWSERVQGPGVAGMPWEVVAMTAQPSVGRRRSGVAVPPTAHAGVVTRVLAACVDLAGVFVLTVLLDLGAAGVRFAWSPVRFRWPDPGALVTSLVIMGVAVAYLTVGWAVTGRSYGARLLGLRVVVHAARAARLDAVVLPRAGLRGLPRRPAVERGQRTRRSVQDLVFRTVVVYDAPDSPVSCAGHRPAATRREL